MVDNKRLVWEEMQQDEDSFDGPKMEQPKKATDGPTPLKKGYNLPKKTVRRIENLGQLASVYPSSRMGRILDDYIGYHDIPTLIRQLSTYITSTKNNTIRKDAKELLTELLDYTTKENPEIMAHCVRSMEINLDNAVGSKMEKELHKEYDAFFYTFEKYKKRNFVDKYEEEYEAHIEANKKAMLKKNPNANYERNIAIGRAILKVHNMAEEVGSSRMNDIVKKYRTDTKAGKPAMGTFIRELTWYVDTTKNEKLKAASEELLTKLFDYTMKVNQNSW